VQIWILTKACDIDSGQILGVHDHELGTQRFTETAREMYRDSRTSAFSLPEDVDAEVAAYDPLAEATRADDDSLYLEIRGDVLTLTPHDYVTAD